jgi:Sulfotransferase domain
MQHGADAASGRHRRGIMGRVFRAFREACKVLTGQKPAGRGLTVLPDDVFIVSYPRSGNTWTRFLVGNLVYQDEPVTFANVESRIPEIYLFPDRVLLSLPRPRILKSHECFDPRYQKIIYLVRDPRDIVVSYYHYAIKLRKIEDGYPLEQFVPRLLAAEFDIQWSWAASWSDHVLSWLSMRHGTGKFLLVRYEEMLQDPERELTKVATFLKLNATPERVAQAVALSSAKHMRGLEQGQSGRWALTKNTRQDRPFVRTATAGGWRAELSSDSIAAVESACGPIMRKLGYALSTDSSDEASAVGSADAGGSREGVPMD